MRYLAWSPDLNEDRSDAQGVEAASAREAAEQWAKDIGLDAEGDPVTVCVAERGSRAHTTWSVRGDLEPTYTASAVERG